MSEASPSPPRFPSIYSAITPNDLGYKAAYWSRKPDDPVTFRPIIGWMTGPEVHANNTSYPYQWLAIVPGDEWCPELAGNVPHFGCICPKDVDDQAELKKRIEQFKQLPEAQINVRTVARA